MSRRSWILLHRYAGLAMAFFLVVAGITGTIIAFYEEIDHFLSPQLFNVTPDGEPIAPLDLHKLAEASEPRARVNSVPLRRAPDEAAVFYLQPRIDAATGKAYAPDFDEIFLDPYDGRVLGKRNSQEGILPFIYRLHYTVAVPDPWGRWVMGITALIWTLDCFVGFYLTLPTRKRGFWRRWKAAWLVKWRASTYRINFDLHRAAGLWTWVMLLALAVSSVQYNLYDEVFRPTLTALLPLDDPFQAASTAPKRPAETVLTWEQALERGRALMRHHAQVRQFNVLYEDSLRLDRAHDYFVYSVKSSLDIRDRFADTRVIFSAADGRDLGFTHPYVATGNAVSQWLGALHTGRVGGLPYRVFLALMGVVVAMLSITGIIIWWKKRRSRWRAVAVIDRRK